MEQDQYLVAPLGERWAVKLRDNILATFSRRGEAIEAAITVAQSLGAQGIAGQVLSSDADGDIQPIWTYGVDAYCKG